MSAATTRKKSARRSKSKPAPKARSLEGPLVPDSPLYQVFTLDRDGAAHADEHPMPLGTAASYLASYCSLGGRGYVRKVESFQLSAEAVPVAELLEAKKAGDATYVESFKPGSRDRKEQERFNEHRDDVLARSVSPMPAAAVPATSERREVLEGFAQVVCRGESGVDFVIEPCIELPRAERIAKGFNDVAASGSRATVHVITLPNYAAAKCESANCEPKGEQRPKLAAGATALVKAIAEYRAIPHSDPTSSGIPAVIDRGPDRSPQFTVYSNPIDGMNEIRAANGHRVYDPSLVEYGEPRYQVFSIQVDGTSVPKQGPLTFDLAASLASTYAEDGHAVEVRRLTIRADVFEAVPLGDLVARCGDVSAYEFRDNPNPRSRRHKELVHEVDMRKAALKASGERLAAIRSTEQAGTTKGGAK